MIRVLITRRLSYLMLISRYTLMMMQQIGSNGTQGHMKPKREIDDLRMH
jgi:hypothetical protein